MLEPITREEIFLAKAIGETVPDLEPIIRQEMFLAKIAGMDIATPVPVTREERYLNAIATKEVIDLMPITRREMFLAKAMGADIEVPSPITRIEYYLSQFTGGGSGGGSYEKYSWEGVFASIDKGTYATDYAIGDMIPMDLGSEGLINMQIAAFDTDDLADGSGKAPITWIAKELLKIKERMNDTNSSTGGWEKCKMRTYIKGTIKPLIPENVRNKIAIITKTQWFSEKSYSHEDQTTEDDVWIPGYNELLNVYTALFPDQNSRIKTIIGGSNSSYGTRDSDMTYSFYTCSTNGSFTNLGNASNLVGVCLCFCT